MLNLMFTGIISDNNLKENISKIEAKLLLISKISPIVIEMFMSIDDSLVLNSPQKPLKITLNDMKDTFFDLSIFNRAEFDLKLEWEVRKFDPEIENYNLRRNVYILDGKIIFEDYAGELLLGKECPIDLSMPAVIKARKRHQLDFRFRAGAKECFGQGLAAIILRQIRNDQKNQILPFIKIFIKFN